MSEYYGGPQPLPPHKENSFGGWTGEKPSDRTARAQAIYAAKTEAEKAESLRKLREMKSIRRGPANHGTDVAQVQADALLDDFKQRIIKRL